MITAIHQPNFLPWVGYFNKIANCDIFVFLDDVQFGRGKTFTSRTKILIQGKENWLTIPVLHKSDMLKIKDIKVESNFRWKKKHLRTLEVNYKKHPYFDEVFELIVKIYKSSSNYLIDYNIPLIINICNYLNINVEFIYSHKIEFCSRLIGWKKLLCLLINLKTTKYLSGSGKGSKRYVDQNELARNNIGLLWQDYKPKLYPQYNKNNFIPNLSIIDLLFNTGQNAIKYIIK